MLLIFSILLFAIADCAKDDNQKYLVDETPKDAAASPPISEMLKEMTCSMKFLKTQTNCVETPKNSVLCLQHIDKEQIDPQTPGVPFTMRLDNENISYIGTPQDIFKTRSTGLKVMHRINKLYLYFYLE